MRWSRIVVAVVGFAASLAAQANGGQSAGLLGVQHQREVAVRQCEQAREAVTRNQAALDAAKREFNRFLAEHFEELTVRDEEPLPPVEPPPPHRVDAQSQDESRHAQLSRQLGELARRRDQLLERLLPAHPEVVALDSQIAEVTAKRAGLGVSPRGTKQDAAGGSFGSDTAASSQREAIRKRRQAAARRYDENLARVRAAEQDLAEAVSAAELAQQRLTRLDTMLTADTDSKAPLLPTTSAPPSEIAPAIASPSSKPADKSSQPLALAALVIALAVAALAAVRLARSNSETTFATVDDVAAALALPVVGILPLGDDPVAAQVADGRIARPLTVAAQMLLATVLFALIAYAVQNPSGLWDLCQHPLDAVGRFAELIGVR